MLVYISLRFIARDFRVDFLKLAPSRDFETSSHVVKKTIGYLGISIRATRLRSGQNLLARTTSILRNALTELEGTLSANRTKNNVGDQHGVSVGTSSIRERFSDDLR